MRKENRIRKNEEFVRIINERHSSANASFVLYESMKKQQEARAGISVSKKLGDAVTRNRIKRQVREMIKALVDFEKSPKDLIVIVRKGYLNNSFLDNQADLEKLVKKAII